MLPCLARKEVDRLIAELQDAQFRLESLPSTTIEFVKSLTFLDDIQVRVSHSVCGYNIVGYSFYWRGTCRDGLHVSVLVTSQDRVGRLKLTVC